nr:unnamed protein product [Callosobruchus chinensis]
MEVTNTVWYAWAIVFAFTVATNQQEVFIYGKQFCITNGSSAIAINTQIDYVHPQHSMFVEFPEPEIITADVHRTLDGDVVNNTTSEAQNFDFLETQPKQASTIINEPLHNQLVLRWSSYIQEGIENEQKEKIIAKYPLFEECPLLKTPELGPELESCLDTKTLRQDKFMAHLQYDTGYALAALGSQINKLLASGTNINKETITALADAAQLICNIRHALSTHRKLVKLPKRLVYHLRPTPFKKLSPLGQDNNQNSPEIHRITYPGSATAPDLQHQEKELQLSNFVIKKYPRCTIKHFASLIGKLVAACPAVTYGWAYIKDFERAKYIYLRKYNKYSKFVNRQNCLLRDLNCWLKNLKNFSKNRKLRAVLYALKSFGKYFASCHILLKIDNKTAIACINKRGSSHFLIQHNLRPPQPKYSFTWDPQIVLNYLKTLYPLESLNLEKSTYKLVMLLALETRHRSQTLMKINIDNNINIMQSVIYIKISGRIKTSGPNKPQPLLISGIDTNIFSSHRTTHAATSAVCRQGVTIDTIKNSAGWSSASDVFSSFYNLPSMPNNKSFTSFQLHKSEASIYGIKQYYPILDTSSSNEFRIPFSVRIKQDAHLFLCDGEQTQTPLQANCYWIMIGSSKGKMAGIRKCYKGDIGVKMNEYPRKQCSVMHSLKNGTAHLGDVDELSWKHFLIERRQNSLKLFKGQTKHKPYLELNDLEFAPKHLIINSYNRQGLWKFHHCKLEVELDSLLNRGTTRLTVYIQDGQLCIFMFVAMCEKCKLDIFFENENKNIIIRKMLEYQVDTWQEVRIIQNDIHDRSLNMVIDATAYEQGESEFWAINDMRICHEPEYRYVDHLNAPCEKLDIKEGKLLDINSAISDEVVIGPITCPENTFGRMCLPCDYFYRTDYCPDMKYCEYVSDKLECHCSAGFHQANCIGE